MPRNVPAAGAFVAAALGMVLAATGVAVAQLRFQGGAHFRGSLRQHMISFVSCSQMHCTLGDRTLRHKAPDGSLAICPAGLNTGADWSGRKPSSRNCHTE